MSNLRIALSGPASSGKSTLLSRCKDYYNNQFEYADEITRKIKAKGLPINEEGTDITQLLIINSHIENSLIKNVILDRCILDGVVYTHYLFNCGKISKGVLDYAHYIYTMLHDKYDVIFYTEPVNLEDDGVRSNSKEFRDATILLFNNYIDNDSTLKNKIIRLSGSIDDRFNFMKSTIASLQQKQ